MAPLRLIIFTDVNGRNTARLVHRTIELARARGDIDVRGIVTSHPERFGSSRRVPGLDLARLQRSQGVVTLVPPGRDPNDPAFVRRLAAEVRPQIALAYYCVRILRRRLRGVFEQAVNYHDGSLPRYRGVMATSFSIFAGETRSGFAFHRMTAEIDGGPILIEGSVPVDERSTLAQVSRLKLAGALAALPQLLDLVAANDPGRPQLGEARSFSTSDAAAMTRIPRPENLTAQEILRRVRAFGRVVITIDGVEHAVTRLRRSRRGRPLTFATGDGQVLRALS